jgi:hypothetical protein
MKCPACKMETAPELGYCDFCKEPFRRKDPPPKAPEKVAVPPDLMAKLLEAKRAAPEPPAGPGPDLPPEFAQLAAAERMPAVPPMVRYLAWAFLAGILTLSAVGFVYVMTRPRPKAPADGAPPGRPPRREAPPAPAAPPADLPPGVPDEEPLAPPPPRPQSF